MLVRVENTTRATTLGERIRIARSFGARWRGLLFRRALKPGEGLLIQPCNAIHMFGMRFPIDCVFVDADLRVLRCIANLKPWRATWIVRHAQAVLELPVGTLIASQTQVGDRLGFRSGPRAFEPIPGS